MNIYYLFLLSTYWVHGAVINNQAIPDQKKHAIAQQHLYRAINQEQGSSQEIYRAISEGAQINERINGQYPIVLAVIMNNSEAVQRLINNGAVSKLEYQHYPLAFYAIKKGYFAVANILITNGNAYEGSINRRDVFAHVALKAASLRSEQYPEFNAARNLMSTMARIGYDIAASFAQHDLSHNPWYIVLRDGHLELIKFFLNQRLDYPFSKPADSNKLFTFSDKSSWTPLLILLDNYIQKQKNALKSEKQLYEETRVDLTNIENLLKTPVIINSIALPDGKEHTALSYALHHSADGRLINLLLDHKASLEQALNLLLARGFSPNSMIYYHDYKSSMPLLFKAITLKDLNSVKKLVDAGADFDSAHEVRLDLTFEKKELLTPLQAAIKIGYEPTISYLIEKGAE